MDESSSISGRYASSNVLKEMTGPTPYAKKILEKMKLHLAVCNFPNP
jgi:hypothetical protein